MHSSDHLYWTCLGENLSDDIENGTVKIVNGPEISFYFPGITRFLYRDRYMLVVYSCLSDSLSSCLYIFACLNVISQN